MILLQCAVLLLDALVENRGGRREEHLPDVTKARKVITTSKDHAPARNAYMHTEP
jgi:hypothetical protein